MENALFHFPLKKEREKPWQQDQQKRPLNWLLFFWLGFIYIQDILAPVADLSQTDNKYATGGMASTAATIPPVAYLSQMNSRSLVGAMTNTTTSILFPLLAFTLLMALQGGLHWLVLFTKINRR